MATQNPSLTCVTTSGLTNTGMKCLKPANASGLVFNTCAKWRYFYPNCNKSNKLCNSNAGAWVAATTVCSQRLF